MSIEAPGSGSEADHLPDGLDAEICEFGSVAGWLMSLSDWERALLAERCPDPVPPKVRQRRRQLWWALLARWAWPETRRFFVAGLRHITRAYIERLREDGVEAVYHLEETVAPVTILWAAGQADLPLGRVWTALSSDARTDLEQVLPTLRQVHGQVLAHREGRADWAKDSRWRAVQAEVARATRGLRLRTEQAQEKSARAQQAAEVVIRGHAEEVRALREELDEARRHIAELEGQLAAAREHQAEVARLHARVVAQMATRRRDSAGPRQAPAPMSGHSVLVVGDVGRQAEYRRIVESMGGEFAFFPGFGNPAHLAAAAVGATVLVLVTAWASHKAFDQARGVEEAGVPLILVPQAGAARFREALEKWIARASASAQDTGP